MRKVRTIWLSDIHLGTRGCQADFLLDFLRNHEAETIYLVGDIIDWWQLRKTWYFWRQSHNDVIQKLLRKARHGTKIVFIPGNHDELLREYVGMRFGGVSIERDAIHVTADGKRLLVTHGDDFDAVVTVAPMVARLGSWAYDVALVLNLVFNSVRRRLGLPYWSLSAYLKHRVKDAVAFIASYEHEMVKAAKARGADGVVCGHIHKAEIREVEGILYCNDGDWVESCTALVEEFDGSLEVVEWTAAYVS